MGIIELLLIAVGLAMDAFAVAVCKGLAMKEVKAKNALIVGIWFGGFQAIMPFIGWLLGIQFEQYIVSFDHWVAFVLLGFIGGKMIYEAVKGEEEETCACESLNIKELLVLAVATSIDALAVGITFAFLGTPIVPAISIIGVVTFVISVAGVAIGHRFGVKFKSKAEFAGGLVLVLIGLKILLEHLGVIAF